MTYQIGDAVNVRATVKHVLSDGGVIAETSYGERIYPKSDELSLVDRPLKPGDAVYIGGNLCEQGTLIAIHDGKAWVNMNGEPETIPVDCIAALPTWASFPGAA